MWSLAALSVAALCCSVLGARMLSEMVEQEGAQAGLTNQPAASLRQLAASSLRARPKGPTPVPRGVAVDNETTATIPGKVSQKLDPCGKADK